MHKTISTYIRTSLPWLWKWAPFSHFARRFSRWFFLIPCSIIMFYHCNSSFSWEYSSWNLTSTTALLGKVGHQSLAGIVSWQRKSKTLYKQIGLWGKKIERTHTQPCILLGFQALITRNVAHKFLKKQLTCKLL